jgi:hypothetical protein
LEVGGYYKTPQFPIWVVGSTSHFTVLFGDASCLHESASDILLEQVRHAFKTMEGGAEENGFIQTHQLYPFFQTLDFKHLPEHSVQTLAATMEVHGADIILLEDLWKRTSRLLTGASLESVLEWMDTIVPTSTASAPVVVPTTMPTHNDLPLSDEALARKLHAELNGEFEPEAIATPNNTTTATNHNHNTTHSNGAKPETYGKPTSSIITMDCGGRPSKPFVLPD